MPDKDSLDIFGIKPIGEAINATTKAAIIGAGAFLGRICLPAAEEFGLLLKDKISFWRLKNFLKISEKAENLLKKNPDFELTHAHPRLIASILAHGSWSDDDTIQNMWGGLLASSCTSDGQDDSNLFFINLLSQLTKSQAKILNYCCEKSQKYADATGNLIGSYDLITNISELSNISWIASAHIVDRELDHLRSLGLIKGGIYQDSDLANIAPTPLALSMYVRCQGSLDSPVDYFHAESRY
jgi:hypothetical protein